MSLALVTGSDGFIGRHFVRRLLGDGWDVAQCDITRGVDCREHFARSRHRYDLVVHAAAVVGGRATIDTQGLMLARENLSMDASMFEWAARTGQPSVLYFSSSAAYPVAYQERGRHRWLAEQDIDLTCIRQPDATYGLTKVVGEQLAAQARNAGVGVHVVRPFSGYGSDQSADYPFGAFIDRARRKESPFIVWGNGDQARDFVHVDDIVQTCLTFVAQFGDRGPLNLGTGIPTTFDDLAALACKAARYDPPLHHVVGAPTGVHWRVADVTRMCGVHVPGVSLHEGIARAFEERSC